MAWKDLGLDADEEEMEDGVGLERVRCGIAVHGSCDDCLWTASRITSTV